MLAADHFSSWLGIKVKKAARGRCVIKMIIRKDMLNGFGIAHGGVTFAMADTALAIASNSYNRLSLALDASISYPVAVNLHDELTATASEVSLTHKTGLYQIMVTNQQQQIVAVFKGIVYRTSKPLLE